MQDTVSTRQSEIDTGYERLVAHLTQFRDRLAAGEITSTSEPRYLTLEETAVVLNGGKISNWTLAEVRGMCEYMFTEMPPFVEAFDLEMLDDRLCAVPNIDAEGLTQFIDSTLPEVHRQVSDLHHPE